MTHGVTRRAFLKASAATAVATALATTPIAKGISFAQSPAQDLEILNYALTLEHLEARAYRELIAGGLLTGQVLEFFRAFGAHETTHVETLTETIRDLGGTPVQEQENYNWPTFNNQQEVLEYFHTIEELGAAAYLGQAPRIQNAELLTAAVSIHNVEGQHAAVLADLIGAQPSPAFAAARTMEQVLQVVTPILTTVPAGMPRTGRVGGTRQSGGPQIAY
jgi:hypothetical protein